MASSVLAQVLENVRSGTLLPIPSGGPSPSEIDRVLQDLLVELDRSLDDALIQAVRSARGRSAPDVIACFDATFREVCRPFSGPAPDASEVDAEPATLRSQHAEELEEIEAMIKARQQPGIVDGSVRNSELPLEDIQNMIELLK